MYLITDVLNAGFCFFKQTRMPTVQHPVCLLPRHPATATNPMMVQTLSPNKDAQLRLSSLSWTVPTGNGEQT